MPRETSCKFIVIGQVFHILYFFLNFKRYLSKVYPHPLHIFIFHGLIVISKLVMVFVVHEEAMESEDFQFWMDFFLMQQIQIIPIRKRKCSKLTGVINLSLSNWWTSPPAQMSLQTPARKWDLPQRVSFLLRAGWPQEQTLRSESLLTCQTFPRP